MTATPLQTALRNWDGKSAQFLIDLYQSHQQDPTFMDALLLLYHNHAGLRKAITWLIKHHMDQGGSLNTAQVDALLAALDQLTHWESQLHVLQVIPKLALSPTQAASIEPTVSALLQSEKKFVKAAAYEAYFEVVRCFPELGGEFRLICEDALERESASVKVKLRRILKQLPL